jgi:hypothetical protein
MTRFSSLKNDEILIEQVARFYSLDYDKPIVTGQMTKIPLYGKRIFSGHLTRISSLDR